ncbi:MAG TPA: enoyl-ACP reductase [Anaerolineales bacterium]|nr:enoyl-ACP reductase [Anaerolineales bacterium]
MGILEGKKALVFGVANNRSIAWGIAQALHREGAQLAFSYAGAALLRRVSPLAEQVGADFVEQCDLSRDDDLESLFAKASAQLGNIDILIHSVAFANRDELNGPYYATSREGFRGALDISCYSFTAMVRHALPLFNPGSSCLAMTYYGAEKAVPHYNVMGVAKAALEASVRYLAADLGPLSHRVNAISAGPIRTLAAAGVSGFKAMHREFTNLAPLQRNVTIEDVGNAAVYLCSDLATGVTGEVHYVDSGFNVIGLATPSRG